MELTLYSLAGIVIGAALQYFFTKFLEERRHLRELRTSAYVDYLRAVSEIQHSQPKTASRTLLGQLTDAKLRVTLYGTVDAVQQLARFEENHGHLRGTEAQASFTEVIGAMRNDSKISAKDLSLIIFGARSIPGQN